MKHRHDAVDTAVDHLTWVRTRLILERDLRDAMAQGFVLITTGFGSFAILSGVAPAAEHQALPRGFSLAATAIGVLVILLGIEHYRRMTAWVDGDEFRDRSAPALPDERRPVLMAAATAILGLVSFVALLLNP
jgi:hypothetical protein